MVDAAGANRVARWQARLQSPADPLVLGVFRIAFGLVMAAAIVRFIALGWAEVLYVQPTFHFTYPGFGWVRPLPLWGLNALLAVAAGSALLLAIGWRWRLWLTTFLVSFTYIELIDAANYLNHHYFVVVLGLLMLALPMGAALVPGQCDRLSVPTWTVWALRMQIGLVYFFAGVAKLNPDWLIDAMPLKIWLAARGGMPVIGPLLDVWWMPWVMSWGGALFDLSAPFLLALRRTRPFAYMVAIFFHAATYVLFNIGVFPFIMMAAALVFFEADEWRRLGIGRRTWSRPRLPSTPRLARPALLVAGLLVVQLAAPLRHWLYPGDRLWTEEGYRFSWHVMVAEKTGSTTFFVTDPASGQRWAISPSDELSQLQDKQMSFQPDLIWQYAQHIERRFQEAGYEDVEVRSEAYASVNGRPSRLLIDPDADLTQVSRSLGPKGWIMPNPLHN